jgi:holo-[acyl-carrier protein] synthase
MIVGVGIDTVEITRFKQWKTYSANALKRVLSDPEIDYCLSSSIKSAERFAVRFALREAFYKAYSSMLPDHTVPFLTVCKKISLNTTSGVPQLIIDWESLCDKSFSTPQAHCSLTHCKNSATAIVILESL